MVTLAGSKAFHDSYSCSPRLTVISWLGLSADAQTFGGSMETLFVVAGGFLLTAVVLGFMYVVIKSSSFRRNRAIGIRTRATLASDEAWVAGHRASAPWIASSTIVAALSGFAAVALALLGVGNSNAAIAVIVIGGFGSVFGSIVTAAVVASRAASATLQSRNSSTYTK